MKRFLFLFTVVIIIPFMGLSQNGLTLGYTDGTVSNIDLTTANQTLVSTTQSQINAADFGPNNVFYGINSSTNELLEIDTANGSTTTIATIALSNRVWSGLAYDVVYDVMYGISVVGDGTPAASLYSIDIEDGALTLIGTQTDATSIACIGIDEYTGGLYGLDIEEGAGLFLIDRYDGSVTLVGETGLDCSGYGYGMDYCLIDSSMYITTFNDQSFIQNSLRIIDLTNGSTTVIGEINDVTGALAIPITFEASFSSDTETACQGGLIFFYNETFGATEWYWEFEEGTPSTSTSENPIIRYNNIGTFDVTLIASNDYNSDTITIEDYISSIETPIEPNEPSGEDIGISGESQEFTIEAVEFAQFYTWSVSPEEAGIITGDSLVGTIAWDIDFIGIAEITVTAENDCGISPSSFPHSVNVLLDGIGENQSLIVEIYPNPASNMLNISFKNIKGENLTMELFSVQGLSVLNREVSNSGNENHLEIDISNLSQGIYFLSIKSNGIQIGYQKVMITK